MIARPLPVLMYHAVAPISGPLRGLGVPVDRLREHLAALGEAGYRVTGLTEGIDLAEHGVPVVAMTFDDAYANFLDACPVLAAFGAGATLYVPVAHVGGAPTWLGSDAGGFGAVLDWPDLRDVAALGIEIGNHGLVHEPLDVLPGKGAARQIEMSRDTITAELGRAPRSFAYPHGYHSAKVRAAVAAAGHHNACQIGRRVSTPHDDRYAIPRLQPTPEMSGEALVRCVRARTQPRAQVKRMAQPGWRMARRAARTAGIRLT